MDNKNCPAAPKDPVARKNGFYLYKNKMIQGTKRPDGSRTQEIYLDDGRMISAAGINGNLTDENMLQMLACAGGFRKLVRAVGVSAEADTKDKAGQLEFSLIFYGHTDKYVSGTHAAFDLPTDGIEKTIVMNDIEWNEDDDVPGQLMFRFPEDINIAKIFVRLYLRDGFAAPFEEEELPFDLSSKACREMIGRSVIQTGNTSRIHESIIKAQSGEDVTIAFIGGSITQGAGAVPINTACYAYKAFDAFSRKYAVDRSRMHFIKAGIGGTSSELGVVRYEKDVTEDGRKSPDIVIVEYAVNDAGDETGGDCYEGLVRKILQSPGRPAVILLFSVFADDFSLQERFIPIGERYDLPMVSIKNAVTPQFAFSSDSGGVIKKSSFFYDCFHPSNAGHQIMAECLAEIFCKAEESKDMQVHELPGPVRSADFEDIHMLSRRDCTAALYCTDIGDFTEYDTDLQCVERDMSAEPSVTFADSWMHVRGKGEFRARVECRLFVLLFKDSGSSEYGRAEIYADGCFVRMLDPREVGWTHDNAAVIIRDRKSSVHDITIKMSDGDDNKKFTILGFGIAGKDTDGKL